MFKYIFFVLGVIQYAHAWETTAYSNGFTNLSVPDSVVIVGEYQYSKMLKDALYGKNAKEELIPDYEKVVFEYKRQVKTLQVLNETLSLDNKELRKVYYKREMSRSLWLITGIIAGTASTIVMYSIVSKTI